MLTNNSLRSLATLNIASNFWSMVVLILLKKFCEFRKFGKFRIWRLLFVYKWLKNHFCFWIWKTAKFVQKVPNETTEFSETLVTLKNRRKWAEYWEHCYCSSLRVIDKKLSKKPKRLKVGKLFVIVETVETESIKISFQFSK